MPDFGFRHEVDRVPRTPRAQGPVHILVEKEEPSVEQTHPLEYALRDQDSGPSHAVGLARTGELTRVGLAITEHSSTVGTSGVEYGTRVPHQLGWLGKIDHRAESARIRMAPRRFYAARNCVGGDRRIVVEQKHVIGTEREGAPNTDVVSTREPEIALLANDVGARVARVYDSCGVVS